jgi:hypothetical protein
MKSRKQNRRSATNASPAPAPKTDNLTTDVTHITPNGGALQALRAAYISRRFALPLGAAEIVAALAFSGDGRAAQ